VILISSTGKVLQDLPLPTVVLADPQHTFLMNCLHLLLHALAWKQGLDEKITNALDGFRKLSCAYLELIIGFILASICIVEARVEGDELRVFVVSGEFFRAHEEHVLQEVSQSKRASFIHQASHTHRYRTSCFLCNRIMDKEHFELVGKNEGLILPLIVGRLIRKDEPLTHTFE